jgi:polyisoprenyl-phosphate glycosyltransferase
MSRPTVSIIAPCYNEAEAIACFYAELSRVLDSLDSFQFEILLVDDGSTDGTLARLNGIAARDSRVRVYALSRNFGHQASLSAGLDAAVGDAVLMLDSDLQHPPSLIPRLLLRWREGYDVVSTVRERSGNSGWFKRVTSDGFYHLFNRLSGIRIEPGAVDFCLLSRRACNALNSLHERHRFLRGLVTWIGYPRCFVPYRAADRVAGRSKYNTRRMLTLAADAVFSFSAQPMRLASRVGLVVVLMGLAYLAYIVGRALLLGDLVEGWASLIGVVLLLGGVQLTFLGVIGEYVGRIFEETKRRPLYLLKQSPPPVSQGLSEDEWQAVGSSFLEEPACAP